MFVNCLREFWVRTNLSSLFIISLWMLSSRLFRLCSPGVQPRCEADSASLISVCHRRVVLSLISSSGKLFIGKGNRRGWVGENREGRGESFVKSSADFHLLIVRYGFISFRFCFCFLINKLPSSRSSSFWSSIACRQLIFVSLVVFDVGFQCWHTGWSQCEYSIQSLKKHRRLTHRLPKWEILSCKIQEERPEIVPPISAHRFFQIIRIDFFHEHLFNFLNPRSVWSEPVRQSRALRSNGHDPARVSWPRVCPGESMLVCSCVYSSFIKMSSKSFEWIPTACRSFCSVLFSVRWWEPPHRVCLQACLMDERGVRIRFSYACVSVCVWTVCLFYRLSWIRNQQKLTAEIIIIIIIHHSSADTVPLC